ncbi:MAG: hypothetical protein EXR52_03170 [Dehalococcoidia bacterium]|nr:hypothetical protein [Dehalococcoidia bacterium]
MLRRILQNLFQDSRGRQRGQAMVVIAVSFVGLMTAMGLAVDGGNLFLARIRLSRAVDAAALPGALQLPDCCASGTTTYTTAQSYLTTNEPGATVSTLTSPAPGRTELTGCSNVPTVFMGIIGINSTDICATALAGYGAIDLCIALDDTQSMDGIEMKALKDGVRSFTYMMNMSSTPSDLTSVKIGLGPFRGGIYDRVSPTVLRTDITPLTADREVILRGLNEIGGTGDPSGDGAVAGHGGSGTSIGVGVKYCTYELVHTPFARPPGTVEKIMILFTDGNNESNAAGEFCLQNFRCGLGAVAVASSTPNPSPTPTVTPNPAIASTPTATHTSTAGPATATRTATPAPPSATPAFGLTPTPLACTAACLDRESRRWAKVAKDAGITIFTIGYGATQCGGGTCAVDSDVLKEVASGSDKYYFAATSGVIGEAFAAIGQRIGHRLLK